MAVNPAPVEKLAVVPGVTIGTASAGIKQSKRDDLAVFAFAAGTQVAGVYTQSHFAAAPVLLARERQASARSWVINSGNANAATGAPGIVDAGGVCAHAARLLQIPDVEVQPFSTGVIGERLPVAKIQAGLDKAVSNMVEDGWVAAAHAIMTTDTVPKGFSRQIELDGARVTITGIAKGSGMIKPDMATMLSYVATDAVVGAGIADRLIRDALRHSFNRITVDGDTSTNDCFMLACTQQAGHAVIESVDSPEYAQLSAAITDVATLLAQAIVRDGEGATKFVTITVRGGHNEADCLAVAYTVAESPLVKTALFAGDANWGRFCMAIGRSAVSKLDTSDVALWLDEVQVARGGLVCDTYTEEAGAGVLAQDEFSVLIEIGNGDCEETVWTTDLSYEYIRINAEYRT